MVRAINRPGLYGDGNTLYLKVAPGGSKQWIQRLTVHGKRRDIHALVDQVAAAQIQDARARCLRSR